MKIKAIYICYIILYCVTTNLNAQDIHFSQFFASPLNINPANTGNFDGSHRFIFNNKNQWQSFADAYRTFAGSIDANFVDIGIEKSVTGIGLQINNDVAGDGKFGTNQFYFNLAYCLPISKEKNIFTAIGANAGYVFHNIDYGRLTFGDQYNGSFFSSENITEEMFKNTKMSYPDFGLGLSLMFKNNPRFMPQAGISISHINTPKRSFYTESDMYLPIKWIINAGAEIKANETFYVEPLIMIMLQQKYQEYDFGALCRYDYNYTGLQSIYFGGMLRAKDAGIIHLGVKYDNIRMTISYDINISKLTQISRGKGGIELSLIYIFTKAKPFPSPYYRKCPDFI